MKQLLLQCVPRALSRQGNPLNLGLLEITRNSLSAFNIWFLKFSLLIPFAWKKKKKKKLLTTSPTKFGLKISSLQCISDLCLGSGDFNKSQFCVANLKHLKMFCVVFFFFFPCLSSSGGADILNRRPKRESELLQLCATFVANRTNLVFKYVYYYEWGLL